MAQKTLIIGLGSTGLEIALDVLRRIQDEFGSLQRVPWVEAVCFETARVSKEDEELLKGRQGDLGISHPNYETLVANLSQFDDMDALAWADPKALRAKDLAEGTTNGAGNVRMIGRLCWMYGPNLNNFQTLILEKLEILKALTEAEAGRALGNWPYRDGPPEIRFTRDPQANEDRITIYVCGTLTGGTCSGSFIDVGYFLGHLAATRNCTRIGLFTIPNPGHPEGVRLANAYAALRELNHYHSPGSVFNAKYPGVGLVTSVTATPFSSVFLAQPSGGDRGAVDEVIRSFGQFIYLQGITPVGDAVAAELVNPNATRSGATDTFGNPMNFNSLGVAVVEFPAEHVVKGCTKKLVASALEQWQSQPELEELVAQQVLRGQLRLESSLLSNDILTPGQGAAPYRDMVQGEIDRAVQAAHDGAIDVMASVQAGLDGSFDARIAGAPNGIATGDLAIQIKEGGERLQSSRLSEVREFLRDSMADATRGPNYCYGLVKALKAYALEQRGVLHQEMENLQQRISAAASNLGDARERIEDCHSAAILRVPGFKRTALNICCQEYEDALQSLYFTKLDSMTIDVRYRIFEELAAMADTLEARIGHGLYGIKSWGTRLQEKMLAKYESLVNSPPKVNGHLIYDAKTIPNNYEDAVRKAQPSANSPFSGGGAGEAFAKLEVIRAWNRLADEFITTDHSYFDEPASGKEQNIERVLAPKYYEELERAARGYFLGILRRDVCQMLEKADYATEIKTAFQKSNEQLKIFDQPRNKAVGADGPGALHKPRLAFFAGAKLASDDSPAGKIRGALSGMVPSNNIDELLAPYRIVLVTARATFSLSMIDGLRPEASQDGDTMRRAYVRLQDQDNRSYQTRRDVRWKSIETAYPFKGFFQLKSQLIGAMAAGYAEISAGQGVTLIYDLHSQGDKQGRLPLGKDLDEAVYLIHEDARVEGAFKQTLARLESAPFDFGPKLREVTKRISAYGLTDKQEPVDEKKCREILRSYVLLVPGLKENYDTSVVAPSIKDYYRPESSSRPAGYYCNCGAFITDRDDPSEFPEFCNCGNRLRFDIG